MARGLMLPDSRPTDAAHSARSRTPWEVTAAGSRAVDSLDATMVMERWRRAWAAAHIQRWARGFAGRQYYQGR
eukprot:4808143-Prymnesium_polylepis.1